MAFSLLPDPLELYTISTDFAKALWVLWEEWE